MRVVVDTNVVVGALRGKENAANRQVLRLCLSERLTPLLSNALFYEYEDVLARPVHFADPRVAAADAQTLITALLSVCEWIPTHYRWRPNLRDEADNHLVELAVAGNAEWIVTNNIRDFTNMELTLPLRVLTPANVLKEVQLS
jgi:putative PIN family toxin of toxin-antitoxin system